VNTNVELELVFHEAMRNEKLTLPFNDYTEAYNFRQRLYRYREALRSEEDTPLSLVLDHFTFEVQGSQLNISYEPTIWEKLNASNREGNGE
jgi:hypothetical protein